MKKLHSLKIKIILPVFFILILVFSASSLVIIDREYNSAKNSLINSAESYSSLAATTIMTNYEPYYNRTGALEFFQIVEDLLKLNKNVIQIQIIDLNGNILFEGKTSSCTHVVQRKTNGNEQIFEEEERKKYSVLTME